VGKGKGRLKIYRQENISDQGSQQRPQKPPHENERQTLKEASRKASAIIVNGRLPKGGNQEGCRSHLPRNDILPR
jgi:hypothetical protein